MQAIRRKLNRLGLHLNQLQDLGGCRAIVPKIDDVKSLIEALKKKSRHDLRGIGNDDITSPKPDGYRSHHLIFTYCGLGRGAQLYRSSHRGANSHSIAALLGDRGGGRRFDP